MAATDIHNEIVANNTKGKKVTKEIHRKVEKVKKYSRKNSIQKSIVAYKNIKYRAASYYVCM